MFDIKQFLSEIFEGNTEILRLRKPKRLGYLAHRHSPIAKHLLCPLKLQSVKIADKRFTRLLLKYLADKGARIIEAAANIGKGDAPLNVISKIGDNDINELGMEAISA